MRPHITTSSSVNEGIPPFWLNFELNRTESFIYQLRSITTSKQIELESPGWSGFVTNSNPDQT